MNKTCVALVSKLKFFCASLPSLPPKGGLVRITSKAGGAPSNSASQVGAFDSVLPCQRFGGSMPCSTRFASAIGNTRFSFSRP